MLLALLLLVFAVFGASLHAQISLGVDLGTSGIRICLIDASKKEIIFESSSTWILKNSPDSWKAGLNSLVDAIPVDYRSSIERICISGTSASALLFDTNQRRVSRSARMYNFNVMERVGAKLVGPEAMEKIKEFAPADNTVNAPTSTLAKLLAWNIEQPLDTQEVLMHQADYVVSQIAEPRKQHCSDWHNSLKLGYDVHTLCYPNWLKELLQSVNIDHSHVLPEIIEPGRPFGLVDQTWAKSKGIPTSCQVIAGTTDSIAAFLASGADQPGQAVTSLGSTLAIKALSTVPVQDASRGIYSHRLGDNQWLVGGASNVGCAIFRHLNFTDYELQDLSAKIDPMSISPYKYYPLIRPGERFPVNDPFKMSILEPVPILHGLNDRRAYLHGLLQSIAHLERDGYEALTLLGATPTREVLLAHHASHDSLFIKSSLLWF